MRTILVVDDTKAILTDTAKALRVAGYEVVTETHGSSALEYLREHAVDLVITDIYMPDLDGFEILRLVHERHPGVPVIAMSADPAPFGNALTMASAMGAQGTLWKPFVVEDLLDAVGTALDGSSQPPRARTGPGALDQQRG